MLKIRGKFFWVCKEWRVIIARLICPPTHRVAPYEPTQKMTRSAAKSMSQGVREGKPWVSNRVKHIIRYQWMLDAIEHDT